jgi:hypothetical protein
LSSEEHHVTGPSAQVDSAASELRRILDELGQVSRRASARADELLGITEDAAASEPPAPLVDEPESEPESEPAPVVAREPEQAPVATTRPASAPMTVPPTVAPTLAPRGWRPPALRVPTLPAIPPTLVPMLARLRTSARPVATVVTTVALVLGGWLLVLEPALGSSPVLVMDDGMSPALRLGDVAFAEEPTGPLSSGAIVAVRIDGSVEVSRLIDREPVPPGSSAEVRAAASLIVRDDADDLEVREVVAAEDLIGVIGAAVPRVGLPVVWLRSPSTDPLGTFVTLLVLAVTAVGLADARTERRERRAAARSTPPSAG